MKLALMLGGMVAGRRVGGPAELLAQGGKLGGKLVSGSPELARLTEDVRGRLFEAGKDAALAVATRRVESWAERVANPPARGSTFTDEDTADRGADNASLDEDTGPSDERGGWPADVGGERDRAGEGTEDDEDTESNRRGGAARSGPGGTATRARRATATHSSGRTRSTGGEKRKRSEPRRNAGRAGSGREARDA